MFAYFGVMSIGTLDLWPWGIKTWLETNVSAKRIEVTTLKFICFYAHLTTLITKLISFSFSLAIFHKFDTNEF